MALLLNPGDKAVTRGMPVSELNGKKGTIVCYMEATGRYLFELDDTGKAMSLRKENIKTENETEVEAAPIVETVDAMDGPQDPTEHADAVRLFDVNTEGETEIVGATSEPATAARTATTIEEKIDAEIKKAKRMKLSVLKMKLMAKGISPSSFIEKSEMIRAYARAVVRESERMNDEDDLRDPIAEMPDIRYDEVNDHIFHINDLVMYRRSNGTSARALVVEGGYAGDNPSYFIRILSTGVEVNTIGSRLTLISRSEKQRPAVRKPDLLESFLLRVYENVSWPTLFVGFLAILWLWPDGRSSSYDGSYSSYIPRWHWHWHWWYSPFGYYSWWGFVGGLGSLMVLAVFTQKLGTSNGRRQFSWDRAWQGLLQMDLWEMIRLAMIFEGALAFLGAVSAGGRRRRY